MLARKILTTTFAVCMAAGPALAQNEDDGEPGPEHRLLSRLTGDWEVHSRPPGATDVLARPTGSATAGTLLGGRFLQVELTSTGGPVTAARYTFGFDRRHGRYTVVAMDNSGTYWVAATGRSDNGRIVMYGSDDDPYMAAMGIEKEFAIVLDLTEENRVVIETLFIDNRTEARAEIPFMAFELRR